MNNLPSIFNDVIGPVMRGPSSSHTAASWRIACIAIDLLNDRLDNALIEFDRSGAWAPNFREQGTTIGMDGGLLGLDISDDRMKYTETLALERKINIEYKISSFPTSHPNTVRMDLRGRSGKQLQILAISTGGGAFEIQSIDGFRVSLRGDRHVVTGVSQEIPDSLRAIIRALPEDVDHQSITQGEAILHVFASCTPISGELFTQLENEPGIDRLSLIKPVMPVIPCNKTGMPFSDLASLTIYLEKQKQEPGLAQLGRAYEQSLTGLTEPVLEQKMEEIIRIIHESIDTGMDGTTNSDRILQQQSHLVEQAEKAGRIKSSFVHRIISYAAAIMESKSALEVVVAVPTAGSCGTVGSTLRAVAEDIEADQDAITDAYFAAGLVGVFFAQGPGFSAEEHGCQVECGAASGMAAAGLVQLMGGTASTALDAASMAIQNMIGLVCDPVADRVEVPCLGKNISAAVNAYTSAIMALSGFDAVIPLDQVIQTIGKVSSTMPCTLKCTGMGGLAITDASKELKEKLKNNEVTGSPE